MANRSFFPFKGSTTESTVLFSCLFYFDAGDTAKPVFKSKYGVQAVKFFASPSATYFIRVYLEDAFPEIGVVECCQVDLQPSSGPFIVPLSFAITSTPDAANSLPSPTPGTENDRFGYVDIECSTFQWGTSATEAQIENSTFMVHGYANNAATYVGKGWSGA